MLNYTEFFNFHLCVPIAILEGMNLSQIVLELQQDKLIVIHKIEDPSHPVFANALQSLVAQKVSFKVKAILLCIQHIKVYKA